MSDATVNAIRAASRQLVRELGFMGEGLAGTDHSPSAVHALIEIEAGGMTARQLGSLLRLEKSSVSRMLRKLVEAGEVTELAGDDARTKVLSLTDAGRRSVSAIHAYAHLQVSGALSRIGREQQQVILNGLRLYAKALTSRSDDAYLPKAEIVSGYRPGLIARITEMHALYYARTSGFGQKFEAKVAQGLAEFSGRAERPMNALWTAVQGQEIVGSIAIDGEDLGSGVAHLRWFIVDEQVQGGGVGSRLLGAALDFVDEREFSETQLWTFRGLSAARHLYEKHGFVLKEERPGTQWGKEVREQSFVRKRPA